MKTGAEIYVHLPSPIFLKLARTLVDPLKTSSTAAGSSMDAPSSTIHGSSTSIACDRKVCCYGPATVSTMRAAVTRGRIADLPPWSALVSKSGRGK